MSHTRTGTRRLAGLLFQTLLCWTLIAHSQAGHRPYERGERPRYPRHHDRRAQRVHYPSHHGRGTQRIEYPSVGDRGSQGLRYPWLHDRGQRVQFPSVDDATAAGSQIQRCAPGYYRDASGPYTGQCVPCQCNGLADECDERTGRCRNCQYNTAGDRCERCKEGYYGNAAQRSCTLCPCPFSVETNSFALGCREVYGDIQCICKTGYTGERCESCAPGFFGDPLSRRGNCQPCNCNSNGNNCDPKTGVCKNTLEPGDTNTDERCQECDNCAQTLLKDLEKLDEELQRIKSQLGNATASASAQERIKNLEKALLDTKDLVNKYSVAVNNQRSKADQLEEDQRNLSDDIDSLQDAAKKRAAEADQAVAAVEKTHKRAKALDADIKSTLKKIQDLLDQLKEGGTSGETMPTENHRELLDEARRMVKEMEERDFRPQKTAAEEERDAAKKLLEDIQANVSKQSDDNEATAKKLQDLLKSYEDKLKDLDEALQKADDSVKKANRQNGLNAQAMEDLKNRIKDLNEERKTVQEQMAMAGDELQKAKDLGKMLTDSKTEYEKLSAELDGAKTGLTKKVNEISKAAAKEDIVEAAEEHARNLTKVAEDLENAVKNASDRSEVRNAKDAIDAYKNITDAINAAEAAANEAKRAADKALNDLKKQNLTERVMDMKELSEDLVQNAKDADRDLNDAASDLNNLKKRLDGAEKKKKVLQKDLQNAQKQLNDIKRDDIKGMIDLAKNKAATANDTAGSTMDRLDDIKKEIDKIKVTPSNSNLSNVLNDVDQTVKNLLDTIPSLNDKISEVENLTSQFTPLSNITENIRKIKELIEQARDAANRIAIPMKFTGDGHVELRPPKDLDDLKAYTSLALALQRPEGRGDGRRRRRQARLSGDMFVLYLGNRDPSKDYIGMVLRNNVLFTIYKLNGKVREMSTGSITMSPSEPAKFDRVNLQRIYQDAEMVLVKDITSSTPRKPIIGSSNGGGIEKNLLDLTPSDVVFYVGGYPSNFTPPTPLNLPRYKGCIEFSSVNDKVVSLYNFQRAERINVETPCKRYAAQKESEYYEGSGYSKVVIDKKLPNLLIIKMSLNSRSENGLLVYAATEKDYFTVTMEKGNIFLRGNLLAAPASHNIKKFPTDDWVEIQVICTSRKIMVRESGKELASADVAYKLDQFKEFYVGGAPLELRERNNITTQPYKGCLKNLKLGSDFKTADEQMGVSKGCPKESLVSRRAEFNLGSSLSANFQNFALSSDIQVSVGFKSTASALQFILHDGQQTNQMGIALLDGHVVFNYRDSVLQSNKQYNDDQWHYVTVTSTPTGIKMMVDDEDEGQVPDGYTLSIPDTAGAVVLGGSTFKGCISNLYTRRPSHLFKAEDLSTFQTSGDVLLDVCAAESPAQLMLDRTSRKESVTQPLFEPQACAAPALVPHAYRMYGHASSLSYGLPLQVLQPRPHFSLDVRTRASEGLLFFAATRGGRAHLALYISKGRIRLSVGREKEIFNREKYNDGRWHSVIFSLERKKFRLVVDGIRAQDGQLTQSELTSMQLFLSPVYLGAAPEAFHKELKSKGLPKHSVSGCIRHFKMNGAPMQNPASNGGAGPCFEGQTQRGAYFSGSGAHVIINDSLVVGSSLELLFNIRPRGPTGLLLFFGNLSRSQSGPEMAHYLAVYMHNGEVVAKANNGKGEFMVKVKPKASLCDGTFHKISVIQRKNVVQLHVDTVDSYKIGPPLSTVNSTKSSVYVGGLPETSAPPAALPVTASFAGCIQDMTVNGEPVLFDKLPGVFGAVNVRECPG